MKGFPMLWSVSNSVCRVSIQDTRQKLDVKSWPVKQDAIIIIMEMLLCKRERGMKSTLLPGTAVPTSL